jgi:hypothetical protein
MEVVILAYGLTALLIGLVALFLGYRELKKKEAKHSH